MMFETLNGTGLHYRLDGPAQGAPVVFLNPLGTDLRVWDGLLPLLPPDLRLLRVDTRGHGLSDCPPGPYRMGALVSDIEALLDHLGLKAVCLVGVSLGGMIAQGLAAKRLDLVRTLVLSNTAAKIGTRAIWEARADAVTQGGVAAVADDVLARWLAPAYVAQADAALLRNMLLRQNPAGYAACCAAIAGSDFYTTTAALRLPTLGIAGSADGSTPPDLVRETVNLVPGSDFALIRGAGHLPWVEAPAAYADALRGFLRQTGSI
jgi:3-oxoadipate enol-lactonase